MLKNIFIYLFLLLLFPARFFSQNVVVKGKAHLSYKNKVIQLYTLTDFITNIKQKETQDTIENDGFFELSFHTDYIQPVFLKIDNVTAQLYVQPDFVYGITIPEIDSKYDYKNDAELPVNIGIIGSDSTELNALTFDYQAKLNNLFTSRDSKYISRATMFKRADSLKKLCSLRYNKITNPYFKNYYEYSIASINASVARGQSYLVNNYIINKPIQYYHYEYMQFFNSCFSGYLNSVASSRKGESLYNIINVKGNYEMLSAFLSTDKLLKTDSLRELVIIKNLWDFYYSAEFSPEAIEAIISDLNQRTKIEEHKKITATILSYFNKMQQGSPAPNIYARTKTGTTGDLSIFKGKWIYLNFFTTKNLESIKEMPKIASLKKKFGDKMVFVSICLDDSLSTYTNYVKSNLKFDWNIWYNYDKSIVKTGKESYFVTGSQAYFLINNSGYLAQSPALSPSNGIEYKLNVIFKPGRKNTKTGIR
jgi:hypothetical protein